MAQRRHHQSKRGKTRSAAPPPPPLRSAAASAERRPVVTYGKPFVVLEDTQKSTFIYKDGQWVRHSKSIAECRQDCQVKELAQKINGMTRYEVCSPL